MVEHHRDMMRVAGSSPTVCMYILLAQLVERLLYMQSVVSSSLAEDTLKKQRLSALKKFKVGRR